MFQRLIGKLGLPLLLAASLGGCATVHGITHTRGVLQSDQGGGNDYFYIAYWEGTRGFSGVTVTGTYIKRCVVQPDNSLVCTDEESANRALNE